LRLLLGALVLSAAGYAQVPTELELFEKSVRPFFVQSCQGCHNANLKSGDCDLSSPSSKHDLDATGLALLGIDHLKLTYPYSGHDFRLTDTAGSVHDGIFA
jgi:Protein of unknown function (DUF1501)